MIKDLEATITVLMENRAAATVCGAAHHFEDVGIQPDETIAAPGSLAAAAVEGPFKEYLESFSNFGSQLALLGDANDVDMIAKLMIEDPNLRAQFMSFHDSYNRSGMSGLIGEVLSGDVSDETKELFREAKKKNRAFTYTFVYELLLEMDRDNTNIDDKFENFIDFAFRHLRTADVEAIFRLAISTLKLPFDRYLIDKDKRFDTYRFALEMLIMERDWS